MKKRKKKKEIKPEENAGMRYHYSIYNPWTEKWEVRIEA